MAKQNTLTNLPLSSTATDFPNIWAMAILAFTFILYFNSLSNGFTNWDDPSYVGENPMMKEGLGNIFTKTVLGNYHPLTMFSLWLNYQISGLNAKSYHLFNLLLHLANTYLVFQFIWNISDKKKITAAFVALFFAIHPMHVESVAWIAERKDVLYSSFFLLGLNTYWKYLENQQTKTLIITFLYFTLSLLSKPAAIVFPAVMLLLDYYKSRNFNLKIITEKVAFFAMSIGFAILTYYIQVKDDAVRSLDQYNILDRIIFACYDIMMYVSESVVPFQLSPVHPFPKQPFSIAFNLAPLFVVALLGVLYFFRKQKTTVFGFTFFFINIILVLQIVTIGQTVMSERYTYIPYIGLFFSLFYYVENQLLTEKNKTQIIGIIAAVGLCFSYITAQQINIWKDSVSMWTKVLEVYPDSEAGLYNRSKSYSATTGKETLALEDLNNLIINHPKHIEGITNRGRLLARFGKYEQAFADFNLAESLTNDPKKLAIIISNRSYCYFYSGDKPKAIIDAKKAIDFGFKIDPKYWEAINSNDTQAQQQSNQK